MSTTDPEPLAQLLRRIAQGDPAALRRLYEHTCVRAFGVAFAILRDRDAAEDATAELYAQVWRSAADYSPERGSVLAWLSTLARTRAIDLRRAREGQRAREAPLAPRASDEHAGPDPTPLEHTQADERTRMVHRALAGLPPEQRAAIRTAYFGGLSYAEAARALRQPLGTVKTRIRAGLASLRHALGHVERDAV